MMSFEHKLLKMNPINTEATTERGTPNNLVKEIKQNHKKYLINPRKGRKRGKLRKEQMEQIGSWLTHSNQTVSVN